MWKAIVETPGTPSFRVHIALYEDVSSWILGKMATKLRDELTHLGISCDISKYPDETADINHHIAYWGVDAGRLTTTTTIMITHVDTNDKFEYLRSVMVKADVAVCMSRHTMTMLAEKGLPRSKLCFIHPAHDGSGRARKTALGIASRLYQDGRKREGMLPEIAERISPDDFRFLIMGAGWEGIVDQMRSKGFSVDYHNEFDPASYASMLSSIDYYLYFGTDEGSMGFVDALAAGVPTIVTPQGFHLDVPGGITYAFTGIRELEKILAQIAEEKRNRQRGVADWTWAEHAHKHLVLWEFLLAQKADAPVPQRLWPTLKHIGIELDQGASGLSTRRNRFRTLREVFKTNGNKSKRAGPRS